MTFWAKLLTILILVLSLVFATMSAFVFTQRTNLNQELGTLSEQYDADVGNLNSTIEEQRMELAEQSQTISDLNAELAGLKQEYATLQSNHEQVKQELSDTEMALQQARETINTRDKTLEVVMQRNEKLEERDDVLEAENHELSTKLTAANAEISDLKKTRAELEETRDNLEEALADARDKLRFNEEVFNALAQANIEAKAIIEDIQAVPTVSGRVVYVDPETRSLVLNVGREQGVRKAFNFTIYRGDEFVAKASVFEVGERQSAATIEYSKLPVEIGDNATTRLP